MIAEQWMSDELREITPHLTGQQWAGIMQIVKAELKGETQTSVLRSENPPCNFSTFYGRWKRGSGKTKKSQKGWVDNPYFTQALAWARRDYRSWLMEHGTGEAMQVLAQAAAPSARDLERQVVGDTAAVELLSQQLDLAVKDKDEAKISKLAQALGSTQLATALPALARAMGHKWGAETSMVLIDAAGSIAAPVNVDRQKAAMGILDRAGEATAAKQVVQQTGEDEHTIRFDFTNAPDNFLDDAIDSLQREIEEGSSQGSDPGAE